MKLLTLCTILYFYGGKIELLRLYKKKVAMVVYIEVQSTKLQTNRKCMRKIVGTLRNCYGLHRLPQNGR